MLDHRIQTFLTLFDVMNYRETAERLNMTQPAVTQHIQFLEQEYGCKLFGYNGRKLSVTEQGMVLEKFARSARALEEQARKSMKGAQKAPVTIGATKTIGEYLIGDKLIELEQKKDIPVSLIVDNTERLLQMLRHNEIELAVIEGFFNKKDYGYRLFKQEHFVGICSIEHPFANREVEFTEILDETILCREPGSGTRAVLEQFLYHHNVTLDSFSRCICISSFELIKRFVRSELGISFVYEAVAKSDPNLAVFTIKHVKIFREFNYVYLKDTFREDLISLLE